MEFEYVGKVNVPRLEHIRQMNQGVPAIALHAAQRANKPGIYIGDNVLIQEGAVIGGWGMTFERDEDSRIIRQIQTGGIFIEDDVEIGANTVVDIGSGPNDYTRIGEGTKIDNLCDIGHNVVIGKHCYIAPHVLLAGSSQVGDYSWLGLHVAVREHRVIGEHCVIGMGSMVTEDIPAYSIAYGVPCRVVRQRQIYKPDQP